jgi:SAM-dependent methyltransferase
MGSEKDKKYYNDHYRSFGKWSKLRGKPWYSLWVLASRWVKENKFSSVVDVGCGIGPVARLMPAGVRYTGYDFSKVAIERAKKESVGACVTEFLVRDVADFDGSEFVDVDAAIFCEILEHLEDDLALLRTVPAGLPVFITLPDFDSPAHVRFFKSCDEAVSRYGQVIDVQSSRPVKRHHYAIYGCGK